MRSQAEYVSFWFAFPEVSGEWRLLLNLWRWILESCLLPWPQSCSLPPNPGPGGADSCAMECHFRSLSTSALELKCTFNSCILADHQLQPTSHGKRCIFWGVLASGDYSTPSLRAKTPWDWHSKKPQRESEVTQAVFKTHQWHSNRLAFAWDAWKKVPKYHPKWWLDGDESHGTK